MKKDFKNLVFGKIILQLKDLLPPQEITENAACGPETADLFFSEDPSEIAQAREICMGCPVRQLCLEYSLWINDEGIAGGLTPAERLKMRNGQPVFAFEDINEAIRIQRDMKVMNAADFSSKYEITERTYYRWKEELDGQSAAS
jgi:hypothetical protein